MSDQLRVELSHPDAKLPERQNEGDSGFDLYAVDVEFDEDRGVYVYDTGVHLEIPQGYTGEINPRSSVYKKGLILANNTGRIDAGYRGEIKVLFLPVHRTSIPKLSDGASVRDRHRQSVGHTPYQLGERIAQLVLYEIATPEPVEVDSLSDSERGEDGFGSTGNS